MDLASVATAIALVVSGAGGAEMIRTLRERKKDAVAIANDFYPLWLAELDRLKDLIDEMHVLVEALENEITFLGGDPVKIRIELAKQRAKSSHKK